MRKVLIVSVFLIATFVACENTQNNSGTKNVNALTSTAEVKKITEQDYAWVVDSASYAKANNDAYVEYRSTDDSAYAEYRRTDDQAYAECRNLDNNAYVEFNKGLVIIESKLQKNNSVAYDAYLQMKEDAKKRYMNIETLVKDSLPIKVSYSAACEEFCKEFFQLYKAEQAVYDKAEQVKQKKYDTAEHIRQEKYNKAEYFKQEKYDAIYARYKKVTGK